MKWIRDKYDQWCKETKRNGSVLVGGSVYDFFDWLESPSLSEGEEAIGERTFTLKEALEIYTAGFVDGMNKNGPTINEYFKDKFGIDI